MASLVCIFFGKMKFICQIDTSFLKVFDDSSGVFLEPDSSYLHVTLFGCREGAG